MSDDHDQDREMTEEEVLSWMKVLDQLGVSPENARVCVHGHLHLTEDGVRQLQQRDADRHEQAILESFMMQRGGPRD